MKRYLCFVTAVCLLFIAGCRSKPKPSASSGAATPAPTSHRGTGVGYGGELVVEVVTEGDAIADIKLVSDHESSPVMTRAFPIIRERILDAQTPVVDSVSGATFSSFAVKTAVADAARQYGKDFGEISFATKGPEAPRRDLEPVKTQLAIVGGGPAGLAAAIAARESGVENVILIEKLDILSGNGKFDMNFFDLINSQAQRENGVTETVESFIESKEGVSDSPERVRVWAEGSYALDEWLRSYGVNLNYNSGGTNHMAESNAYAGEHIQEKMEEKVRSLGVDVRTGTKGLDFIVENDRVVGVKAQNKNDYYDIMADAVIVATGGFSANKELLSKYAPGAERVETSNQMGATGDFVPVFEDRGYQLKDMDELSVFKLIIKNRRDLTGAGDGFLLVNEKGERFVDESSSGLPLAHTILEQPNGKVFYLYDQRLYDSAYRLQKHNELGYHVKADTLDELAEKLGIDAAALSATVDTYNKAVAGEGADPFRETPFDTRFGEQGPYYGVQVESAIHMTKGGVAANEKAQVLDAGGAVVDGLYAAGEVTATSAAYSGAVVFGRISGQQAAEYILK